MAAVCFNAVDVWILFGRLKTGWGSDSQARSSQERARSSL